MYTAANEWSSNREFVTSGQQVQEVIERRSWEGPSLVATYCHVFLWYLEWHFMEGYFILYF